MSADHGVVEPEDKKKNKKRAILILATVVAASGVGSLAFAYWTGGGGTGGGTAKTSAGSVPVTFVGGTAPTGLAPGGSVTVRGTIKNTNPSAVTLVNPTATVSFTGGNPQADTTQPACDPADFTPGVVNLGANPVAGNSTTTTWNVSLSMADTSADQDNCKGVTATVTVTAS